MFKSEKIVPIGVIVGIGAAASAALAACYVLSKRDEEQFHFNTNLDVPEQQQLTGSVNSKSFKLYKTIPKDVTGAVIGKGGENIRAIQKQTNTRIAFAYETVNEDEDRTLSIKGVHSAVLEASELIESIIEKAITNTFHRIYIPASEAGLIIGKSGATIRAISEESGAKVNIPRPKNPDQQTMAVEIKGDRSSIEKATRMINEKLKISKNNKLISSHANPIVHQHNGQNGHSYLKDSLLTQRNITSMPPEKFERLEIDTENGYQDVYVASVKSPSHFWVQLCGTLSADLDRLMMDMTDYYENTENLLKAQIKCCKPGDIVAAPMKKEEHWYRAKIVSCDDSGKRSADAEVTVHYLDFGDESILPQNQIYLLNDEFLTRLPFQAIECSLYGVEPVSDDDENGWSKEAINCFKKNTRTSLWEKVYVKCRKIIKSSNFPQDHFSIDVLAIQETLDTSIADILIEKGHALSIKE